MNDTLAAIISFVEGHTRPADFEKQMYGDPEMERILSDDPGLPSGSYVGSSTYLYVLEQDYKSLRGIIHAHGALSQFLERKRIACRRRKSSQSSTRPFSKPSPAGSMCRWSGLISMYCHRPTEERKRSFRIGCESSSWTGSSIGANRRNGSRALHGPSERTAPMCFLASYAFRITSTTKRRFMSSMTQSRGAVRR